MVWYIIIETLDVIKKGAPKNINIFPGRPIDLQEIPKCNLLIYTRVHYQCKEFEQTECFYLLTFC